MALGWSRRDGRLRWARFQPASSPTSGATGSGGSASVLTNELVDLACDREDRVDAGHRVDCQRQFSGADKDEEIAAVGPTSRFGDLSRPALGIVELAEAGIGIGPVDPGIAGKMPLGISPLRLREWKKIAAGGP